MRLTIAERLVLNSRWGVLTGTVFCLTMGGASVREAAAQKEPSLPILRVAAFRDGGGLIPPSKGEKPLTIRLSQALEERLMQAGKGRFRVIGVGQKGQEPRFTLEGELSHTESENTDEGPYLCVARLFREGKRRQVVAQWAGYARTYRDISSNIRHDARVDADGLIGELTKRIAGTVGKTGQAEQTKRFAAFVRTAASGKRLQAEVVIQKDENAALSPTKRLLSGDPYRLRVDSPVAGSLYLVGYEKTGRPVSLQSDSDHAALPVTASRDQLAPAPSEQPLNAGRVQLPTEREIVVLVRSQGRQLETASWQLKAAPEEKSQKETKAPGGQVRENQTGSPAVSVLDVGGSGEKDDGEEDPVVAHILERAFSDPPGTWLAARLKVRVVPPALGLWESVEQGKVASNRIQLTRTPGKRAVSVMEKFQFQAKVGTSGYLLLLARTAEGSVELLFPRRNNVEAARVEAGQTALLPEDPEQAYASDRPGKERARAVLLTSREEAEAWLKRLFALPNAEVAEADSTLRAPFFLSEVAFEVLPAIGSREE